MVLIPSQLTPKVSEHTPLAEPNQQVSEVTTNPSGEQSAASRETVGRANPTLHSETTNSPSLPTTGQPTMGSTVPEGHTTNGRDHLPVLSDLCWQNQPVQGSPNPRTMGNSDNIRGLSNYPLVYPSSPCNLHLSTEDTDPEGEDRVSPAEAGNLSDPSLNSGVLLQHAHCAQERWRSETCHQSETPEQICEIRALQNGRVTHSQGSLETARLDGQSGPERCLFHGPNSPPTSQPASLQVGGKGIPIHLPSLWSLHSPKGLYKDPEAICGDVQIPRHPAGNLHGRNAVDSKFQADADRVRPNLNVSPMGFIINSKKCPSQNIDRISEDVTEFLNHGDKTTRRKNQQDQARSPLFASNRAAFSPTTLPAFGQIECNYPSPSDGPTLLPLPSNVSEASSGRQ